MGLSLSPDGSFAYHTVQREIDNDGSSREEGTIWATITLTGEDAVVIRVPFAVAGIGGVGLKRNTAVIGGDSF
jgi:hypothetical protein